MLTMGRNFTFTHNNSISLFRGYEFVKDSPGLAISSIVFLSIASLIGTFGNIVILIVIAKTKEMKHMETIFLVNITISDLYITLISDPMSIVGK